MLILFFFPLDLIFLFFLFFFYFSLCLLIMSCPPKAEALKEMRKS